MGILDLPAGIFVLLDHWLTGLFPAAARLLFWAAVGALVSMELYRLSSPQQRIAALKLELQQAQQRLSNYDGDLEGAWPLIGRMLGLAFRRVAVVLPATIAASLPLLLIIVWMDGAYSRTFPPPDQSVAVSVPGSYEGRWIGPAGSNPPRTLVLDGSGGTVAEVTVAAPIPVMHKQRWWNALIGNPAGYLDDGAPFDRIELDLPRQEVLSFGPAWLRGWEFVFFPALVLLALAFKAVRRIQ